MKLTYPKSDIGCQVIIHVEDGSGFHNWIDMKEIPPAYHFAFGKKDVPKISGELSNMILQSLPSISKVILPPLIPVQAAEFVATIINMNRDIHIEETTMTERELKETVCSDGFTPISDDLVSESGVDDGFHEISLDDESSEETTKDDPNIEHRTLWVSDPEHDTERMNRLSYRSIASVRGEKTYPDALGGGKI